MAKLKVGILGLGAIGKVHVQAFRTCPDTEVCAIGDMSESRLNAIGDEHRVEKRFTRYQDLIAKGDCDAIVVALPNSFHLEASLAAFEAGKHVLLEKPMAMDSQEALKILDARDRAGKVLQMGMSRRQIPHVQVLADYIRQNYLGDIYHMRAVMIRRRGIPGLGGWFTNRSQSGGGPLIDVGVHWFDMAMWLSGHWNPTAVSAMTYAKFGSNMQNYRYVGMWAGPPKYDGVFDVEDYATGMVRFGAAASMSFEIAWAANCQGESYVEIIGDKGGARVLDGNPLSIFTEHNGRLADIQPKYDENAKSFDLQSSKFAAACRGEIEPIATGEQGLCVMRLIDSIYASSEQGREIAINGMRRD
jgi:predicted dehydrogenase